MKTILAIAAILLIIGFAQANIITVCPEGCNYTSIQAAVYAAQPNDTIEVQSGTYNESVVLTKNINFNGVDTGNGDPIVNGDLYKNSYTMVLRGFSFQSIFSNVPNSKDMTPNTTTYEMEKAYENPSPSKAISALKQILKTNPDDSYGWFLLGYVFYKSQRYEESIDSYNESIKIDPYFSDAWNNIGADYSSLNEKDKALEAYDNAIRISPGYALAWNNKGLMLDALGRNTEAEQAFARAKELGYSG